jgi:hypothetical protein
MLNFAAVFEVLNGLLKLCLDGFKVGLGWFSRGEYEKNKKAEENLEAMRNAKAIKDRLRNDPVFLDDVRNKYK